MKLFVALGTYPHTAALWDGSVRVTLPSTTADESEEIELEFDKLDGRTFRRMVRGLEFDVSEMAITTYLSAKDHGKPFTAIPVFPARWFPHDGLTVNINAGVSTPKDLEGKRVGVRAYTVTNGVWSRAVLADQYGVDLDKVNWVIADEEHVKECVVPSNVESVIGADLGAMLASGELAAGIGVRTDSENVEPLLKDRNEKERAWMARGIYPINHTVVIKDELIASYPDIAAALYRAFADAKRPFSERLAAGELREEDKTLAARREIVGPDPIPYGIEANRVTLETIITFAKNQHILTQDLHVEDVFVADYARLTDTASR